MTQPVEEDDERYVVVPSEALSPAALESLVEEFITREGTDYGPREYTLDEKKGSVMRQLRSAEIVIVFDVEGESATLLRAADLPRK